MRVKVEVSSDGLFSHVNSLNIACFLAFQIGSEATTATPEDQKSCTSWNKDGSEKPEIDKGEGSHQEHQPVPAQRYACCFCSGSKYY